MDDLLIEVRQAIEMSELYSSILSGTMEAFASIISNNLNVVMKRLTSISIILTIISLGTRVILAYLLAAMPKIGLVGIWWAVPIGWALADVVGYRIYRRRRSILNFNKS